MITLTPNGPNTVVASDNSLWVPVERAVRLARQCMLIGVVMGVFLSWLVYVEVM